jgi:hypothetical protein
VVQNFLKELTEKGKLTMIKDIAKNEVIAEGVGSGVRFLGFG